MRLNSEFSWSLSKHNIFAYCERAYYYHYYGSWNGWDQYAQTEAKVSFRLKHLKTKELWLKSILKKSIIETLKLRKNTAESFALELERQSKKILSSDIGHIYSESWRSDPKQICIDNIYYAEENISDSISWIKSKVSKYIVSLQNSKLIRNLITIPYPAFINTEKPSYFYCNALKVWCSPDIAWKYNGHPNALNLNFNNNNWAFSAGINVIFLSQNYRKKYSEIICSTAFFEEENCFVVYGLKHPSEIKKSIKKSANQMRLRLSYSQKAYIENFPKTSETSKCTLCRFREICLK